MKVISDKLLKNVRLTEIVNNGTSYKRTETIKNGVITNINWYRTDGIVSVEASRTLERNLFEYRVMNKLTQIDSLLID